MQGPHEEKESDYTVVGVDPGHGPGGVVTVRLLPDEMGLLTTLSENSGRSLSETLRLGLHCPDRP